MTSPAIEEPAAGAAAAEGESDGAGRPGGEAPGGAVSGGEPNGGESKDGETGGGAGVSAAGESGGGFLVRLDNFEGPFDLLLSLIAKHKLDVTEVSLSKVTDEFIAHIRAMGPEWDLDQTSEFLVVAATLLDLKAARLLPAAELEDEEDLALLEARDLLFARLLQYRAYKKVAAVFAERWAAEQLRRPRAVGLEPHHAELLPDVVFTVGPEGFARLAAKAMVPKPKPVVYVDHIHTPKVSVREQAALVVARLRELGEAEFRVLTRDAPDVLTVVARFLALLELYREKVLAFEQPEALGALRVRWIGDQATVVEVDDEFDEPAQQTGTRDGRKRPGGRGGDADDGRQGQGPGDRPDGRDGGDAGDGTPRPDGGDDDSRPDGGDDSRRDGRARTFGRHDEDSGSNGSNGSNGSKEVTAG